MNVQISVHDAEDMKLVELAFKQVVEKIKESNRNLPKA